MTAVRSATGWFTAHDPGLATLWRALRVTAAASVGFLVCRYALNAPVIATYAVFAAIALGVLSDISGPPALRTRTFVAALPVGLALVTIGTAAARSTPLAVVGMLVVGFAVAYAGVGGPRLTGIANGLQLFYILPCFPPYDPAALPQRLAGLTIGILLTGIADRLLWPAPEPPSFTDRLADAADAVRHFVAAVDTDHPDGPREAAEAAMAGLRPSSVPSGSRPTGPGRRDRGLTSAASTLRTMVLRLGTIVGLLPEIHGRAVRADADELLGVVGGTLARCAAALRGSGPPPDSGPALAGVAHFLDGRAGRIAHWIDADELPPVLRIGGLVAAIGEASRVFAVATRAGTDAPPDPTAPLPAAAWYLTVPVAELWWRRLRTHLTPRSVYFQNALRLALGLAAARLAADLLDLSHGFWVLLATLSLMRTSGVGSRLALLPAFLGTLGGAVVAAAILVLVGDDTIVYAVALPIAMLLTFAAGPLLGAAAAQFGFAVVVSVLFAQLSPTTWRLAEVRLLDVVVGGLVGALIGAAVWPRGGAGEVRRSAATCLRLIADDIVTTVRAVTGAPSAAAALAQPGPEHRLTALFDVTYAQYRSEPGPADRANDWLEVLSIVQRAASDAQFLHDRYPDPAPLPWPAVAERLIAGAEQIADAFRDAAAQVASSRPPPQRHLVEGLDAEPPHAHFTDDPHATLRVIDTWGWLHGLAVDLGRAERAAAGRSR
ncbi:MAG TPA: FUSC family protein [Pseudonocardia sp.]